MERKEIFIIAGWWGAIFGIIEGFLLNLARQFPALLAPYKLSVHVLWVAPVIDILLFLLLGVFLSIILRLIHRRTSALDFQIVIGTYTFVGFICVLGALKIVSYLSVLLLSLGLGIAVLRVFKGKEKAVLPKLKRRIYWLPVGIGLLALGLFGYTWMWEQIQFRRLPTSATQATNVLLVVMDTVRYDRFLQEQSNLTPNLALLAGQGARYENAWTTASWSLPSQASLLTGLYPTEHLADWPKLDIKDDLITLPDYLDGKGYVTGAFSGNSSWVTPEYLHNDFLRFQVYIWQDYIRRTTIGRLIDFFLTKAGYHYAGLGKKADQINLEVTKFLDDYPGKPFFIYICYMDVNQSFHNKELNHGFWEEQPPVEEIVAAYDEGVQQLDLELSNLIEELKSRGLIENTLIIITSDHGESFGTSYLDDHNPEGHGTSLYPEQARVPLIISHPRMVLPDQVFNQTVSLQSIPVTITELLGLKDSPFLGDMLPITTTTQPGNDQTSGSAFMTLFYDIYRSNSVVLDNWQYIYNFGSKVPSEEVYNLQNDPTAQNNLFPTQPESSFLKDLLDVYLAKGSNTDTTK